MKIHDRPRTANKKTLTKTQRSEKDLRSLSHTECKQAELQQPANWEGGTMAKQQDQAKMSWKQNTLHENKENLVILIPASEMFFFLQQMSGKN